MNRLPIVLLLCISICTSAQTNFTAGYIIKTNGDTLHGYLQEELRSQLVFQLQFKTDNTNSSVETFTTNEVKAFKYEKGDLYKKITFKNTLPDSGYMETIFALELVEGAYNLYSYIFNEQTYFIVDASGTSYFLYNSVFNANGAIVTEGNYISRLSVLAAVCPNRSFNAEQLNYAEKDISKYIFDLNNCISPNAASINRYQKPKTITQITIFAGAIVLGKNRNQFTSDVALRIIYPQLSKNIFINIGAHYSHTMQDDKEKAFGSTIELSTTKDDIFCLPLTIQYNIGHGIIQPFAYGGFGFSYLKEQSTYSVYTNPGSPSSNKFGLSVIGAIGIEGHLSTSLYIKAEWRCELIGQYPAVGFAYNL
jgi:hypothetical protein